MLLGAEALVALALLVFGWASGGLALAAREETGWLGLSFVLAGSAIAFADDTLEVTMREYGSGSEGVLVGHVTRHWNASGTAAVVETFAVDPNARHVSVLVSDGSADVGRCSPTVTGTPGCTVLAVPQEPGTTRLTVFSPVVPVTPSAPTQGGVTQPGAPGGD
jgi:hypothetical protein